MPDHHLQAVNRIVETIEALLAEGRTILLSKTDGLYDVDASAGRHAVEIRRRGTFVQAQTLEGALEGVTKEARYKVCIRKDCEHQGRPQPLWRFTTDGDSKDGHSGACKACESRRVNRHAARKWIQRFAQDVKQTPEAVMQAAKRFLQTGECLPVDRKCFAAIQEKTWGQFWHRFAVLTGARAEPADTPFFKPLEGPG